ncbi:hypothetical protein ANTRET_LOCUS8388 [Anthophora retusa]
MEYFRSFLRRIGLLESFKVDIISELPLELSQLILRQLDPKSLLSAAQVSYKWSEVCTSDCCLRKMGRHYLRAERKRIRAEFMGLTPVDDRKTKERNGKMAQCIHYSAVRINAVAVLRNPRDLRSSSRQKLMIAVISNSRRSSLRI